MRPTFIKYFKDTFSSLGTLTSTIILIILTILCIQPACWHGDYSIARNRNEYMYFSHVIHHRCYQWVVMALPLGR